MTVMIINKEWGRALDGGRPGEEPPVYAHPAPNKGNSFHVWDITPSTDSGQEGWFWIRNHNKWLDGGGTQVYLHKGHEHGNDWHAWSSGNAGDTVKIIVKSNGKALTGHDSESVTLEDPRDTDSQLWTLQAV